MGDFNTVVSAFGEDHTERLTGVSKRQLRYWDQTNLYRPSYSENEARSSFGRVYSFKDIVALRVLNVLRNQYSVPLQHLRKVSERLGHLAEDRWTGTSLYVLGRRVVWREPHTRLPQEVVSQQYVVPMELHAVISDTKRDVKALQKREPADLGRVRRSRAISHNAPVIAGTRVRVQAVKNFLAAGYTPDQVIAEYPDLTLDDIAVAQNFDSELKAA